MAILASPSVIACGWQLASKSIWSLLLSSMLWLPLSKSVKSSISKSLHHHQQRTRHWTLLLVTIVDRLWLLTACIYVNILLLSDTAYATLQPTTPWVTPPNPGPFQPPASGFRHWSPNWCSLQYLAWTSSTIWGVPSHRKCSPCQGCGWCRYNLLCAILNHATEQYSSNIRDMMTHLFATYDKLTPQQVKAKEAEVANLTYPSRKLIFMPNSKISTTGAPPGVPCKAPTK